MIYRLCYGIIYNAITKAGNGVGSKPKEESQLEDRIQNIEARSNSKIAIGVIPGHFATNHSHVNYYVDMTAIKTTNLACTSASKVSAFRIPLPPIREQQMIVEYLDKKCLAIETTISKKQAILDKLAEYKKSLVYEVVTGKKEV